MALLYINENRDMNRETVNRGKQLRLVRQYRRVTESELCDRVKGLSRDLLSTFENGFDTITDEMLHEIMDSLKWNFKWLDVKHPLACTILLTSTKWSNNTPCHPIMHPANMERFKECMLCGETEDD